MKTLIKKYWHWYFYLVMIIAFALDKFNIIPSFSLVSIGQILWVIWTLVMLVSLFKLIIQKKFPNQLINYKLVVAGLPGLIVALWLLLVSLLGTIYVCNACQFSQQDIIKFLTWVLIFHWPIWLTKEKKNVLRHLAFQFILFTLVNWPYAN